MITPLRCSPASGPWSTTSSPRWRATTCAKNSPPPATAAPWRSFAPALAFLESPFGAQDAEPPRDQIARHPVPSPDAPAPLEHTPHPAERGADPHAETKKAATRMLKVDQAKVDTLMNLIGELIVSKNSLPFLARRAEEVHGSREMSREIKDQYAVIDRLSQEMQSAIMQVRMLPVSDVFDRFPRLVRDMSRKLAKEIELVIEGERHRRRQEHHRGAERSAAAHRAQLARPRRRTADEQRASSGKPRARRRSRSSAWQERKASSSRSPTTGAASIPRKVAASAVKRG